ncbi:hypothetical protein [Acinetobacter sp. 226-1]|uniref:hypothetical protein n=1 Tax=Acinetobacter sp. 226-1 TaxID=2746718 RepID=UPI00257900E6|nr:hypothetical protein [Acinetobacter sp. 226-1]MDM1764583.1 hypothetical protein [Acinetobacter sp. 226-1]MDM1769788.1 hypothetical protein [Acinetobacter sp. 226-4]MDQ9021675.1 hypothetical protein [Acinetobacter sichuanensis]
MGSSNDKENKSTLLSIILFILLMVAYAFIGTSLLKTDKNNVQIKQAKSQKYF